MILDKETRVKTKILNAIMEDPEIVLLLKEKYVDDEIWKFCIEQDPSLFRRMKHPSDAICMFACSVDGSNLKYIKNKFRHVLITGTMCLVAVKSNPKAILYVPKAFMNSELKRIAFQEDPSTMKYFDEISEEFLEKLIIEKPYAIQYVNHPDEEIICNAIKETPNICPYLNKMTPRMVETLKQHHPEYYSLYKGNIVIKND